jgi:hypothetical protein
MRQHHGLQPALLIRGFVNVGTDTPEIGIVPSLKSNNRDLCVPNASRFTDC